MADDSDEVPHIDELSETEAKVCLKLLGRHTLLALPPGVGGVVMFVRDKDMVASLASTHQRASTIQLLESLLGMLRTEARPVAERPS
jgi:hypothetical protein